MIDRRALLGFTAAALFAATSARAEDREPEAPPPLRYEAVPGPRPGYLWEPGHWRWDGRGYAWIGGHLIAPRPHYAHFVHGHWARRGPRWFWVEPHWE